MINPDDSIDTKINQVLYELAGGMVNVMKDTNLRALVYANTDTADVECSLGDLVNLNSQVKTKIELFTKRNDPGNTYELLVNKLKYKSEVYLPAIYIPNFNSCNLSLNPIITIGTDFYSADTTYEDCIPGWIINSENSLTEVAVGEAAKNQVENPIVIVSFYQANSNGSSNTAQTSQSNSGLSPYFTQYQIFNLYESGGRADYHYITRLVYTYNMGSQQGQDHLIRKINGNELGNMFTNQMYKLQTMALYPVVGMYVVTYEDDWYVIGKKRLKQVYLSGGPYPGSTVSCRMKYAHEWYQQMYLDFTTQQTVSTTNKEGYLKVQYFDN